jgi:hypothetical protein
MSRLFLTALHKSCHTNRSIHENSFQPRIHDRQRNERRTLSGSSRFRSLFRLTKMVDLITAQRFSAKVGAAPLQPRQEFGPPGAVLSFRRPFVPGGCGANVTPFVRHRKPQGHPRTMEKREAWPWASGPSSRAQTRKKDGLGWETGEAASRSGPQTGHSAPTGD